MKIDTSLVRGFSWLVAMAMIVGCASSAATTTSADDPPMDTTSTSAPPSTTSTTIGTPEPGTVEVEHPVIVFDTFEASESTTLGEPCIAIDSLNALREGTRVFLREDSTGDVQTTGLLGSGKLDYDGSGPEVGEPGHMLFFYCRFTLTFPDVPTSGVFSLEWPPSIPAGGSITADDFIHARLVTTFTDQAAETDRQRIRAGG